MPFNCCPPRRTLLSDWKLEHKDPKLFTKSQWSDHRGYFLIYRVFVSAYFLVWLGILCGVKIPKQGSRTFIYLSEWTFIVMTCYFLSAAISALYFTYQNTPQRQAGYATAPNTTTAPDATTPLTSSLNTRTAQNSNQLPLYFKVTWFLFSISAGALPMITVVYWPVLYKNDDIPSKLEEAVEVNVHLVGTILIFVDFCISAVPMCFPQILFPAVYGLTYTLFSLIYWAAGGVNPQGKPSIYPVLNWEDKPGVTVVFILVAGVLILVGYSLFYGVYRLRMKIFMRYYSRREYNLVDTDPNEV